MSDNLHIPLTPAAPGRHDRYASAADNVDDLYRKAIAKEGVRRSVSLRMGLLAVPASVGITLGLGFYLGLSLAGLSLLSIIGLSCSPGLAVVTMTGHKLIKGRALKKRVMEQAALLGVNPTQARFLWKAVCHQLDALDRETLGNGESFSLLKPQKNPAYQSLLTDGTVPWDDQTLKAKKLPGWKS